MWGDPLEVWTARVLARHRRDAGPAARHACLPQVAKGAVREIPARQNVQPHKVRYRLERRGPAFKVRMTKAPWVSQGIAVLRVAEPTAAMTNRATSVAAVSDDEKAGIRAVASPAPDYSLAISQDPCFARDHDRKSHAALNLPGDVDQSSGNVRAGVEEGRRVPACVGLRKRLDAACLAESARKSTPDNHSVQVSQGTKGWFAGWHEVASLLPAPTTASPGFDPVEDCFSGMPRWVVPEVQAVSKAGFKQPIIAGLEDSRGDPVLHTSSSKPAPLAA